jgi:hypothetical protein
VKGLTLSIVVFSTNTSKYSLLEHPQLIPLAAHLIEQGYSDAWRSEILDYVVRHGRLTPVECWDTPIEHAAAVLFVPLPPVAGGGPVKSQYTDEEWARRNAERTDAPSL